MSVTNELRHLALYLDELIDTGNGLEVGSSLYEQVQYNNSIIPRLYLMITGNGMNEHICSCSICPLEHEKQYRTDNPDEKPLVVSGFFSGKPLNH